jgi:hypothetical protein
MKDKDMDKIEKWSGILSVRVATASSIVSACFDDVCTATERRRRVSKIGMDIRR